MSETNPVASHVPREVSPSHDRLLESVLLFGLFLVTGTWIWFLGRVCWSLANWILA